MDRALQPASAALCDTPPAPVWKAVLLKAETGGSVAMPLHLASLYHPSRHDLVVQHPHAVIYALDELVCWQEQRPELARSTTAIHRYFWVV